VSTAEEKELAAIQLATVDPDALVPEEKRVKKTPKGPVLAFQGEEFELSDEVGYMALMEWAAASDIAVDSGEGLIAIFHMLEAVVKDGAEFKRFRAHARVNKGGPEEMWDFINAAMEIQSALPTEGPEASASGSSPTTPASTARTGAKPAKGSKR
jgi:hypothetical protein